MFNLNLDEVRAIAGESCNTVAYPTVSTGQLQELFVSEALVYMAKRPLADDAKDQQLYNKGLAASLAENVSNAPTYLCDLYKTMAGRVHTANAGGDNARYIEAVTGLEMYLQFVNQFAGSMVRSAYYVHASALAVEDRVVDLIRQGNSGVYYAGPRTAVVQPETVEEAIAEIAAFFGAIYTGGVSLASQWFKGRYPALQLGGKMVEGEWQSFLTISEVWKDIEATRTERMAASAAARTAALGSALSFINSRAAAEKHMATPGEVKQPTIGKTPTALDKLNAKQCGVTVKAWMQLSEEEQLARLQVQQ